ncbi:unnamed protein product [Heligmosomoides polygyrus]|uniref:Uncharacterized protein n=1 Tax=Heligmosomoides polygyrus TaxID=6339 RepID=A0A183FB23_HELPZ|nr:unnamed protein product [Heligmosomoides polygyrus]
MGDKSCYMGAGGYSGYMGSGTAGSSYAREEWAGNYYSTGGGGGGGGGGGSGKSLFISLAMEAFTRTSRGPQAPRSA